ncbi:tRNA 2-thiouridine(34) synthase MnmA [Megamonas hypermegale]|uniref:tRNA 2-thiouridine(34) synthase MnmA n=1 Tax=Megamonas hypermegale TaxID=158847 RepID=UPI0032099783
MKKKIAVAMSGGVDSSLTAALLLEQGYDVFGVTMTLSDDSREAGGSTAVADAKKVADTLGIKHYVVNYHAEFQKNVINYFIREYARGRTPNPCVACNNKIKFGALLEDCLKLGADAVATGHYARIEYDENYRRYVLKKGLDTHKDQSYVLYTLNQFALEHFLLPLGNYTKTQTRQLAEKLDLPVAHKPESQEICFIPNDDYKAYIKAKAPHILKAGDIVDTEGNVLGRHEGVPLYTVGQRKGLGIAAAHPLYVTGLDVKHSRVIVGENSATLAQGLVAQNLNFITKDDFTAPFTTTAKIRYGSRECECEVSPLADGRLAKVIFKEKQRAVTPGQSVVFYDGEILVGGGVIKQVIK